MEQDIYRAVVERLAQGAGAAIATRLSGEAGEVSSGLRRAVEPLDDPPGGVTLTREGGGLLLREPVLPAERLILLGGGHVGRALGQFAPPCGFDLTVVDDRPEFASADRFPLAKHILCQPFLQAIPALHIGPRDYLAVLTRGHAHDGDCLRAILRERESAYLGLIGSKKRVAELLELLAGEGFDRDRLDRIHTPIGLKIGAVTPEEIGVSILAELIACRRLSGRGGPQSDLELPVLTALAGETGPHAVATILSARGHTPRGAGAKMLVRPDGSIAGTVGGGYGEALAIQACRRHMGQGTFEVLHIRMDADVAAREGMACGGEMAVLIEDVPAR